MKKPSAFIAPMSNHQATQPETIFHDVHPVAAATNPATSTSATETSFRHDDCEGSVSQVVSSTRTNRNSSSILDDKKRIAYQSNQYFETERTAVTAKTSRPLQANSDYQGVLDDKNRIANPGANYHANETTRAPKTPRKGVDSVSPRAKLTGQECILDQKKRISNRGPLDDTTETRPSNCDPGVWALPSGRNGNNQGVLDDKNRIANLRGQYQTRTNDAGDAGRVAATSQIDCSGSHVQERKEGTANPQEHDHPTKATMSAGTDALVSLRASRNDTGILEGKKHISKLRDQYNDPSGRLNRTDDNANQLRPHQSRTQQDHPSGEAERQVPSTTDSTHHNEQDEDNEAPVIDAFLPSVYIEQCVADLIPQREEDIRRQLVSEIPHAEEIDMQEIERRKAQRRRRGRCIWAAGTASVLLFVIVLVVMVVVPVLRPGEPAPTREEQLRNILWPVSGATLQNQSSHQYEAFQWIVHHDPIKLDIDDNNVQAFHIIERYVVALLYFATGGPQSWTNKLGFLGNSSICDWWVGSPRKGIACHPSLGSVWYIQIIDNNLHGTLPHELSALENLEEIVLYSNDLYGPIPTSLGRCRRMEEISIGSNRFTGTIPSFSNLRNFRALEVQYNRLTGTLPTSLSSIGTLEAINVVGNYLSGPLPSFASQNRLERLLLAENLFVGSIPQSVGTLRALERLHVHNNLLTGSIPTSIGRLRNLVFLYLDENRLEGVIPTEIGLTEKLMYFGAQNNQLSGTIPTELGGLIIMVMVFLSNNQLTGTIPSELAELELLSVLDLYGNNLSGSLANLCYNGGFSQVDLFQADCVSEVQCPCCTHCCHDKTQHCIPMHSDQKQCSDYATQLEESVRDEEGTQCHCLDGEQEVSCRGMKCLYCSDDGEVCYIDAKDGITVNVIGRVEQSGSINIQYVRGRDESVSFRYSGDGDCWGSINGQDCATCLPTVCDDGYLTFGIDCTNIGYGYRSACRAGDDPFYYVWDIITEVVYEGQIPNRYNCIPYDVSSLDY